MKLITKTGFWISVILLVNVALKLFYINSIPLDGDEPFTLFYSKSSSNVFWEMMKTENNPPLYFLLQRLWVGVFGDATWVVRLPSLIFSCASSLFLFLFGLKYLNQRIGVVVAFLFTFSSYHMLFSHENRTYALFGLLAILSYYFFFQIKNKTPKRKLIIVLVVINSLMMYTHFFGFFVLLIQGVLLFSFKELRLRRNVFFFIKMIAGVLILFSPYIYYTIYRFSVAKSGTWLAVPGINELYNELWHFSNEPVVTVVLVIGVALTLIQFVRGKLKTIEKAVFLSFIIPYLLMFFISLKMPIFLDRYLIFTTFPYYFSAVVGYFSVFNSNKIQVGLSFVLIGLMLLTINPNKPHTTKTNAVTQYLKKNRLIEQKIYINPEYIKLAFSYHFDKDSFDSGVDLLKKLKMNQVYLYEGGEALEKNSFLVSTIEPIDELLPNRARLNLKVKEVFKNGTYVVYSID